jgi:hypothetical protein
MRRLPRPRTLAVTSACLAALSAPLVASATSGDGNTNRNVKDTRVMFATDDAGNLLQFRASSPWAVRSRAITGLPAGVSLRGIDFRPRTGDLYGLGSDKVVYRINTQTAITIAEGPTFDPTGTAATGTRFGWDFNPTVDKIRVTSDSQDNLRLDPDSGAVVPPGTPDAKLNPGMPRVVGSAYTFSAFSATLPTATTLYAYDTAVDRIQVQTPPNAGTLVQPGVAFGVDLGDDVGFDIAGPANAGYVAGTPAGRRGARLWKVDVTTGARVTLGRIGNGRVTITGLAARQDIS